MNMSMFPQPLYTRGVSWKSMNSVSIAFCLFIIYKKIEDSSGISSWRKNGERVRGHLSHLQEEIRENRKLKTARQFSISPNLRGFRTIGFQSQKRSSRQLIILWRRELGATRWQPASMRGHRSHSGHLQPAWPCAAPQAGEPVCRAVLSSSYPVSALPASQIQCPPQNKHSDAYSLQTC